MAQSKITKLGPWVAGVSLILAAGCSPPYVMSVTERSNLGAALAFAVVSGESTPPPTPAPGPSPGPSDICPECNNQGWVGDGTIKLPCPNPNCPVAKDGPPLPPPEPEPAAYSAPPAPVRMSSTRWTVGRQKNYTTETLAAHLADEHGIDPVGYTREQLQAMHDNIHSGYPALGSTSGSAAVSSSRSSCPNGNCPTTTTRRRR